MLSYWQRLDGEGGRHGQRKKEFKENTSFFVQSSWVHISVGKSGGGAGSRLGEIKSSVWVRFKFEMPVRYPSGQLDI